MSHARVEKARPILDLIGKYESEGAVKAQGVASAYDVVWSGIKPEDRPRKLSAMTVGRVLWWADLIDPLYMSEAAGRYQLMEDTLRGLDVKPTRIFDAECQDELALQLLDRRGWASCEVGAMSVEEFADNLAREWASLPVIRDQRGHKRPIKAGQSYYAGDGLNAAHATPEEVLAAIREALGREAAPDDLEGQIVAWLQQAPENTKLVINWLTAAPEGLFR